MTVSNQLFESLPIVKCIKSEGKIQNVIKTIKSCSRSELQKRCPTTDASLLFSCVQRQNDAEALRICELLCDELSVCNPLHLDVNKQSAIFFAARDGNILCVEYLLKKGCQANQKDSACQTALFYAARDGRLDAVSLLLDSGADINCEDHLGQTALFYAARDGRLKVVSAMIERGADINIKDCNRRTALYYAQKNNYKEIMALLKSAAIDQEQNRLKREPSNPPTSDDTVSVKKIRSNDTEAPTAALSTSSQSSVRNLYTLYIKGPLEDVNAVKWLLPTLELIKIFESFAPSIAVWSKTNTGSCNKSIYSNLRKKWQPIALKLLDELVQLEGGWMFSKPVDCKAWGCPDYYHVILTPMDFNTMRKKIRNKCYERCNEFLEDMYLIFSNCFQYNRPESHVASVARNVEAAYKKMDSYLALVRWVEWEKTVEEWYNNTLQAYADTKVGKEIKLE